MRGGLVEGACPFLAARSDPVEEDEYREPQKTKLKGTVKSNISRKALAMLFLFSSLLAAQERLGPGLDFTAVVGSSSPAQRAQFTNTGSSDLSLTVSISGPFAISVDHCLNGAHARSHCDIYVYYTPLVVGEIDDGQLTVDYGSGSVSEPLTGVGVAFLPTALGFPLQKSRYKFGQDVKFRVKLQAGNDREGYQIPLGELIHFTFTNGTETVNLTAVILCQYRNCYNPEHGIAMGDFIPDQSGTWTVTANYLGDTQYGPSSASWGFYVAP